MYESACSFQIGLGEKGPAVSRGALIVVHRVSRTHEQVAADVIAFNIHCGWRELTVWKVFLHTCLSKPVYVDHIRNHLQDYS
jgi:hypothetical protein